MPDEYPIDMVKGDLTRQAFNEADVIRLRYDGWRRADDPPYERGSFLPPAHHTTQNHTAESEPVIPADGGPDGGEAKPARRRKTT